MDVHSDSVAVLAATLRSLNSTPKLDIPDDCKFDQSVELIMNYSAITGLAVAKLSGGEIEFVKTYGFASLESAQKVDENTLFHIASISKPIMGISLLQLMDKGLVDQDEDIHKYLSFEKNKSLF